MLKNFNKLLLLALFVVSGNQIKADIIGTGAKIGGAIAGVGGVAIIARNVYLLYGLNYLPNFLNQILSATSRNPDLQGYNAVTYLMAPYMLHAAQQLKKVAAIYIAVGLVATGAGIALYKYGQQRNQRG